MGVINVFRGNSRAVYVAPQVSVIEIPLLVFGAESNSGGRGLNSDATLGELAVRSAVKILNNTTLLFEDLNVGTNNLIGHVGLEAASTTEHSWELEIGNLATEGTLNNPTYIVKTGQGASTIAQWNTGGTYSNTMNTRLSSAISILGLTGNNKFAYLYTHGINDRISGTSEATWISATVARFAYLRGLYGMFPIVMTKFMNNANAAFNDSVEAVCNQVENCWFVETDDLGLSDENHWNYTGQKTIASRMSLKLIEHNYSI